MQTECNSMDEYIRRGDAIGEVEFGITLASAINIETGERTELFQRENDELRRAVERIKDIKPAAVAHVVRCEDCKYVGTDATCYLVCCRDGMGLKPYHVYHDDFCSYGERKENK